MKKGKVLDLKRFRISPDAHSGALLMLLLLIFAGGMIVGTVLCAKNDSAMQFAKNILKRFSVSRIDRSFFALCGSSFLTSLLPLALLFLSGTSVLGVVLSPLVLGMWGVRFGMLASCLYAGYGVKGIAFYAVLLIPPAFFAVLGLLLGTRQAISFSGTLARLTFPQSAPAYLFSEFKQYCSAYVMDLILFLLSALIDALLCGAFYKVFALEF